jgi:hypothetical protein
MSVMPNVYYVNSRGEGTLVCNGRRTIKRVKIIEVIGPQDCVLGDEILHRETKGIKFNRTPIVFSKFAHRD